jgi:hypothetical protein
MPCFGATLTALPTELMDTGTISPAVRTALVRPLFDKMGESRILLAAWNKLLTNTPKSQCFLY